MTGPVTDEIEDEANPSQEETIPVNESSPAVNDGPSGLPDEPESRLAARDGVLPGRASPDRPAGPGTEGDVGGAPPEGDAEAAWAEVIGALISRHKDGVPAWFGTYRLASLSSSRLTVYLHDFPIRNPRNMQVGRAADLTITGYAKELAYLWRGVSGDKDAVLDLRSDRPKGGPA